MIGVWLVALVLLAPSAGKLREVTTDQSSTVDSLPAEAQSSRLNETLDKRFPDGAAMLALAVYRREGGLTDADRAKILADAKAISEVDGVGRVLVPFAPVSPPGLVAPDGSAAFTVAPLVDEKSDDRVEALKEVRDIAGEGGGGLEVHVTGAGALQTDLTTVLESVEGTLLLGTGALVLFLLIMIYRSPLIALVPLIVVGVGFAIAAGIVYLVADAFDLTIDRTAVTLLGILMFGAGTDYCLLLVARYSNDLRGEEDEHRAIGSALRRAAPAIAASGLVVAGALCTLLFAKLDSTKTFGAVNALGILVGLTASLTLLPAMLAAFGRRGFWPSGKHVAKHHEPPAPHLMPELGPLPDLTPRQDIHPSVGEREGIWRRVGTAALKRPVVTLVACFALLGVGALGLTTYQRDVNIVGQFRTTTDATEGFDTLKKSFPPGALFPNTVLVDRSDGPLRPGDVQRAQKAVEGVSGVADVSAVTATSRDRRAATFAVTFADDPFQDPAVERAADLRSKLAALETPGVTVLIGDGSAFREELGRYTTDDQKTIIPLVLLVITVTLIILLRSLVAPLFLMATVLVSYFATLGISLVFFDVVLNEPTVDGLLPIFAFVFLVALGVDYNIFYMHRVREEAQEHGTEEGALRALVATGPVITSAGIILAGTFGLLTILPLDILVELGFIVSLGILIDTFIVRTLMVPSIVKLVGDATWWPSRLRPAAPVGVAEAPGARAGS